MAKTSRNAPCPCGSNLKFKKCCLPKQPQELTPTSPRGLPAGTRVISRDGEQFIVSAGMTEERLGSNLQYFERRRRGAGPAQQMADFARPLLDAAGDGHSDLNKALSLGMIFWNLAVCRDQAREQLLVEVTSSMKTDDDRAEFRLLAATMIERHEQMFPDMHR